MKSSQKTNLKDLLENIDPSELKKGIKAELEHANVYNFFKKYLKSKKIKMPLSLKQFSEMIAKAHFKEDSKYYTKLLKAKL
jgi:hypothetical protein